ncbi:hypothetical protein PENTCL1PPCAC_23011, partial [Pristionchus entomophagus]
MRLSFRLMSVRSEKVDETQQRIGGLDELNQFVIIIGGNARSLNKTLYKAVGRGSTDYKLNLQTKYYTNSVTVSIFSTLAQFLAWKSRNMNPEDIFIGALFAIIENEADQLLNEFYIHKLDVDDTQIQSKALVLPTDDMAVAYERCMEWCTNNGFEMVYLRNSEENKSEAVKNKEKLGEARLVELLEIVDWPIKKMETPRLTGHLRLDQVINILESMSDSEDDDIDVIPNEQDKAGILEFLGVYNRKDNGHNGISHGNGRVVEASVDVNVALKGGIISLVSVSGETDGGKKGKGNKGKNGNKGNAANNKQGRRNKEEGNSRMTGGNAVETIRQLPNVSDGSFRAERATLHC